MTGTCASSTSSAPTTTTIIEQPKGREAYKWTDRNGTHLLERPERARAHGVAIKDDFTGIDAQQQRLEQRRSRIIREGADGDEVG